MILRQHYFQLHNIVQKFQVNFSTKTNILKHTPCCNVEIPVRNNRFFERSRTGLDEPDKQSQYELHEHLKRGAFILVDEFKLLGNEIKETLLQDNKMFKHGDTDVIFRFDEKDSLDKWTYGSDKLSKGGNSEFSFTVNNRGKAVFEGTLDTTPPKDGRVKIAGYCAIRSKKVRRSFYRVHHYYWEQFTHVELKIKGDGRSYMLMLGIGHTFDIHWLDMYHYPIFTHGGPYWQTIRVPFSKFYLTSKGKVQDDQEPVLKSKIDSVGIMCAGIPGPFRLEIDYIGVHYDGNENEEFAYENYKIPSYIVSGA